MCVVGGECGDPLRVALPHMMAIDSNVHAGCAHDHREYGLDMRRNVQYGSDVTQMRDTDGRSTCAVRMEYHKGDTTDYRAPFK